jgi:FkbM family methyltransferase
VINIEPVLALKPHEKYLIEIGANTGSGDVSDCLLNQFGWSGVLFEPMPKQFLELYQKYLDRADVVCVQSAVSEYERAATLNGHPHDGDGYSTGNAGSSLYPIPGSLFTVQVPSLTYDQFERLFRVPTMLILDTEGYDFKILSNILSVTYLPEIVMTENMENHDYIPDAAQQELDKRALLTRYGYRLLVDNGHDYIYHR